MPNPHGNSPKPDCCGGAHRVTYDERGIRQEILEEGMAEVSITYTGHRTGSFSVFGPVTKRNYRFNTFNREQPVDERDVPGIVAQYRDFQVAGSKVASRVRPDSKVKEEAVDAEVIKEGSPPTLTAAQRAARIAGNPDTKKPTSKVQDRGTTKIDPRTMGHR